MREGEKEGERERGEEGKRREREREIATSLGIQKEMLVFSLTQEEELANKEKGSKDQNTTFVSLNQYV